MTMRLEMALDLQLVYNNYKNNFEQVFGLECPHRNLGCHILGNLKRLMLAYSFVNASVNLINIFTKLVLFISEDATKSHGAFHSKR